MWARSEGWAAGRLGGRVPTQYRRPLRPAILAGISLEQQQLPAGIDAIEAQRALLGDAVVEASLADLRARLAALQASPTPETSHSLRQVSIAFLDMVGSTTLSQRLDPEDIHAVLDGALAR